MSESQRFQSSPGVDGVLIEHVSDERGLNRFIMKTYLYTGLALLVALMLAQLLPTLMSFDLTPMPFVISIMSVVLGLILFFSGGYRTYIRNMIDSSCQPFHYLYSVNSDMRFLGWILLIVGTSISMANFKVVVDEIAPHILPLASLLTLAIFGGASLYAYSQPSGSLLSWGNSLLSGLTTLCMVQLLKFVLYVIYGATPLVMAMDSIETYCGIIIFTGFIAYDTHKAIDRYKKSQPDHLGSSIEFYLDIMNLIIDISKVLLKNTSKPAEKKKSN